MQRSAVNLISIFFLLSIATVTVVGCDKKTNAEASNQPTEKKTVVSVQAIGRADLTETLVYPVDLQPETTVSINALLSERIVKFPWQDGDRIEKGQVVAKIRADNASQATLQIRAEIESLDAQIDSQKKELARADQLLASKVITQQSQEQLSAGLQVSEAKRKSLEAALSQSAIRAGYATLRAPISGIVANKRASEGDLAVPQIPLCEIMTVDPLKVVLKLTEKDAASVHVKQPVRVKLDAYPGRVFEGSVSKILPYIDPVTRTDDTEVLLPNPIDPATSSRLLKAGMYGRAEIVSKESRQTLAVPEKALMIDDGGEADAMVAFVVDKDNIARRRSVRIGIREGDRVEVLEGLKEGERLVVRGQYGLEDGRPVTIFEKEGAAGAPSEPSK